MFVRQNQNRSGSFSIQIIRKIGRNNKVVKTVGCAKTQRELELLTILAKYEIERIEGQQFLFEEPDDLIIDAFVEKIKNKDFRISGPQLILGKIYDNIGYSNILSDELFKNLVITRIVFPFSKYKTANYLNRHLHQNLSVYTIYRFMDKLESEYKEPIEQLTFNHTKRILKGRISLVFYDMTTLYFEASEEDDFRIPGYSKDGKHQHPQIMIGLLVGEHGYPIGYEIFEGNKAETKTLIPVLEKFCEKLQIEKPIVVADAALLSQKNINQLKESGYQFILGGRIKNENELIKKEILSLRVKENEPKEIKHHNGRLIITYSAKREKNDLRNREKGLKRLEKRVKSGKLTKDHINNRGYNKYLKIKGESAIFIDYEKFEKDNAWDGLKGYLTDTKMSSAEVIKAYQNLWLIEKAFRISKTDLRIRPIYHRSKDRIEAHICICFTAYAVYKEFERLIVKNQLPISVESAIEEIKDIHQLSYLLPKSGKQKSKLLALNEIQNQLLEIV